MIVTFGYPTTSERAGGVTMMYQFANAVARLGHEVRFLHGPAGPGRVARLDELPPVCFLSDVDNRIVDDLSDPAVPDSDVCFFPGAPDRLGLPAVLVQGYGILSEEIERRAFRSPGPKFCVAEWLLEIGATYGVAEHQLIHLPYGLDHEVFRAPDPAAARPIDVAVLYHPFRAKGWDVALEALEILRIRRPGHHAVVFSHSPPPQLPTGAVHLLSPEHEELAREVYGKAKIFVQASRLEGLGLTPVEAMACGAALVSTDCGGSRDYARHDETGVVVPSEDSLAMATAVEALLDDDPRRHRLASAGIAHVDRSFQWSRSGELLVAALERYLADPAPYLTPPGPVDATPGVLSSSVPLATSGRSSASARQ